MHVLRLRIYQPQAHYRVPFTYQRRHTYPIPPYSTVIGFLCNVLGIDDPKKQENLRDEPVILYDELKKIKISIAGSFESKTTEYVWFRNLSTASHIRRFGYAENRSVGGHVEHIGGQSPVSMDILNEVRLVIYLAHEKKAFLEHIRSSLENPVRRLEVLHLGRAEDWIVIEEVSEVSALSNTEGKSQMQEEEKSESNFRVQRVDANFRHFFWIPERIFTGASESTEADPYTKAQGLLYNVPTFWTVVDYEQTLNRHGQRVFEYIRAKLNDGLITGCRFLYDEKLGLPIFLADFGADHKQNMGEDPSGSKPFLSDERQSHE
ncbi:type I-B CRISPR-associated protein Cas5b [Rhodothermus bifroesti]|uniref:type I-B CRISPR-associated protein Cas5b n=1 Tax=Rhodothermus bifroesti TaxID=2823335 RepID=UPI001AEF81BE|nr:type I-B CRISPR-associated protein Cas5b [Rhodothermus bifroesti]